MLEVSCFIFRSWKHRIGYKYSVKWYQKRDLSLERISRSMCDIVDSHFGVVATVASVHDGGRALVKCSFLLKATIDHGVMAL